MGPRLRLPSSTTPSWASCSPPVLSRARAYVGRPRATSKWPATSFRPRSKGPKRCPTGCRCGSSGASSSARAASNWLPAAPVRSATAASTPLPSFSPPAAWAPWWTSPCRDPRLGAQPARPGGQGGQGEEGRHPQGSHLLPLLGDQPAHGRRAGVQPAQGPGGRRWWPHQPGRRMVQLRTGPAAPPGFVRDEDLNVFRLLREANQLPADMAGPMSAAVPAWPCWTQPSPPAGLTWRRCILWNDRMLGIEWPQAFAHPFSRDAQGSAFDQAVVFR